MMLPPDGRPRVGDKLEVAEAPPGEELRSFDPGWVPVVVTDVLKNGFLAKDAKGGIWSREWSEGRWRWTV